MPPRKRKSSLDKVLADAFKLLEKHGVDTAKVDRPEAAATNFRNGDAVVVFAHVPKHFVPGICKECNRPFAHNQPIKVGSRVGFCSDPCRWENWRKTTGLPYSAVNTHDVWEGNPPMVINPDQLDKLKAIVQWFTENQTTLEQNLVESDPLPVVEVEGLSQVYVGDFDSLQEKDPFAGIFD